MNKYLLIKYRYFYIGIVRIGFYSYNKFYMTNVCKNISPSKFRNNLLLM
jgi:hypothetical protein